MAQTLSWVLAHNDQRMVVARFGQTISWTKRKVEALEFTEKESGVDYAVAQRLGHCVIVKPKDEAFAKIDDPDDHPEAKANPAHSHLPIAAKNLKGHKQAMEQRVLDFMREQFDQFCRDTGCTLERIEIEPSREYVYGSDGQLDRNVDDQTTTVRAINCKIRGL